MTRGGTRLIAAIAAAVLAAGLLAACGSSDSSTTTSSSSSATTPSQGGGNSTEQGSSNGQQRSGSGANEDGGNESPDSSGSGSGAVAAPLRVSGGGSDQFRSKGGDNSIQEFGDESDESELKAAAEALHSFFVARAEEDWDAACSYLVDSIAQQLEQLAARSQLKDKGCAAILEGLTRPLPAAAGRETTVVDAGSLRSEGEQSFLIFYGAGKTAYAMPMRQEDGEWKVGGLAATPVS